MSDKKSVEIEFGNSVRKVVDYFSMEFELNYAQAVGVLHLIANDLCDEAKAVTLAEDEDDPEDDPDDDDEDEDDDDDDDDDPFDLDEFEEDGSESWKTEASHKD